MKKLLTIGLIALSTTSAFALNKDNAKTQTVNLAGNILELSEAELYKYVYDEKYKSYTNVLADYFTDFGFDPAYFIDDINKYTDCYATIFATRVSVKDVEILFDVDSSQNLKDAIINNIAKDEINKCKQRHVPYFDSAWTEVIDVYVEKRCGTGKDDKQLECAKKVTDELMAKAELDVKRKQVKTK